MRCKLITYEHSSNGLSLFVIPETPEERELLRAMWRFGALVKCNGVADGTGEGFCVKWKMEEA